VHAGGKRNLLYVIIAEATNMDLIEMAASAGVSYDVLAWTAEWYFRSETLEPANATMVNYHHRLPMAAAFGTGTLASSDGQRFPVKGKSITARHLSRYFARSAGISTHTAVSDQHATLDTKVIAANAPEGHITLDAILGNTDPPILEHATDTHGVVVTWTPCPSLRVRRGRPGRRVRRFRGCVCGYGSCAARMGFTGSICWMGVVSRSRSCRGSCGFWWLGTAHPTRSSLMPMISAICGGSSTVMV
jgi:hypothetical protein